MNLLRALMSMLGWPAPSVAVPGRKLRATCATCGRSIAVVASTGHFYRHLCKSRDAQLADYAIKAYQRSRAAKAKQVPS